MDATDVVAVDDVDLGGHVGDRCGTGRFIEDVVEHELELVGVVLGFLVHGGVVRGGVVRDGVVEAAPCHGHLRDRVLEQQQAAVVAAWQPGTGPVGVTLRPVFGLGLLLHLLALDPEWRIGQEVVEPPGRCRTPGSNRVVAMPSPAVSSETFEKRRISSSYRSPIFEFETTS